MKKKCIFIITLNIIILFTLLSDSFSTVVKQMNLEQIANEAQTIFAGVCIEVKHRYDEDTGRDATFFKFKVTAVLKGKKTNEIEIKVSDLVIKYGHAPMFKPGNEVILFLYGKSTLGFTSPVGLGQGKFSVRYSAAGKKVVVNENNNLNLFKGIGKTRYLNRFAEAKDAAEIDRVMTRQSGAIDYQSFLRLVESVVY